MPVYPRGCGGTRVCGSIGGQSQGLSPRVRGNHQPLPNANPNPGSIPPGAGEPCPGTHGSPPGWVYPRGCGGTSSATARKRNVRGLSPRVRGNLRRESAGRMLYGSIPAGAGEPIWLTRGLSSTRVYPRGCGGTSVVSRYMAFNSGLSPRVRGNRSMGMAILNMARSIPAGAGEPSHTPFHAATSKVYPRGCGGTSMLLLPCSSHRGLSPRGAGEP